MTNNTNPTPAKQSICMILSSWLNHKGLQNLYGLSRL
jgi:hypothetical protein